MSTGDEFRTQPHDPMAEQIVLGSMMSSSAACSQALKMLVGSDFYNPQHALIFETAAALYEARQPTEIGAVHARLLANGTVARVGGAPYLMELVESAVTPGAVAHFAGQIADLANRRALIAVGQQISHRAWSTDGANAEELNHWAAESLTSAIRGTGVTEEDDGLSADDLLADPPGHRWLIPGLLERGDRLVLTGSEGLGKSTLTRQLAVCAAAGLHPFTHVDTEPIRVLVVDAENGRALTLRRYAPLIRAVGKPLPGTLSLHLEPGGLDLTQRSGAAWLMRRVEKFKPDLIVIGPLYRLHFGDPNDERDARRVAAALDNARNVHGAGLILEAHSPHQGQTGKRTLRPVGSSLWMRWPEFGYGIRRLDGDAERHYRVSSFEEWRGPRDERHWPKRIRSGGSSSPWPWVIDDETEVNY